MTGRDFHNLVTQFSLAFCFFADSAKQKEVFACKDPVEACLNAIAEFFDEWIDIKQQRRNPWTRKYHAIEDFSKMLLAFGDAISVSRREGKRFQLLDHPDWLAINKKAFELVADHDLHKELA